jgi:type II secretory pathway component PulF
MFAPYTPAPDSGLLASEGLEINDVRISSKSNDEKGVHKKSPSLFGVSSTRVLMVLNQLAVMSQNGIEIVEALDSVRDGCRDPRLATALDRIYDAVSSGHSFSAAVAKHGEHFPVTLAPMLAAAEATGGVPATIKRVSERMRGELTMRGQIIGALIYPVILLTVSFAVMSALVVGVLPQFQKVFESLGRPVPISTQYLLALGQWSRDHWIWIGIAMVGTAFATVMLRQHAFVLRLWSKLMMYTPLIRDAYRPLAAGRNFRTLAAMVGGGVPMLSAVRLTRNTTHDVYWTELWDEVENSLIEGRRAGDVLFDVDFLPQEAAQLVATAEKTGRVAEVLEDIGAFYEEEAGRRIKRLIIALEPVIILLMGIVVAGVVMSVMLPLLDVSTIKS